MNSWNWFHLFYYLQFDCSDLDDFEGWWEVRTKGEGGADKWGLIWFNVSSSKHIEDPSSGAQQESTPCTPPWPHPP